MKGHFKKIIAVLLVCAFAITGVAVIATDGLRTLENVKVGGIRIVIDNKEFTCTDASGAVVEPMIYNGTTYIPVRAVSTAFGKAVHWDGEESTVYLGNMDGKLQNPTVKLVDLKNISGHPSSFKTAKNIFDNYDNFYNSAQYCYCWNIDGYHKDCCQVLLDGKYNTFKATLFVRQGDNIDSNTVTIIGDEKVLYKSDEITKTSKPIDIAIDVTNINDFKIMFAEGSDSIYIANAGFYQ